MARIENFVRFMCLYVCFESLNSLDGKAEKPEFKPQSRVMSSDLFTDMFTLKLIIKNKIVVTIKEEIYKFFVPFTSLLFHK